MPKESDPKESLNVVRKTRILVCVLTLTGNIRCELVGWREKLMHLNKDATHPFEYDFSFVHATKPARLAHNKSIELLLTGSDADWIWIWADDMIPLDSSMRILELTDRADMVVPCVQIWTSKDNIPVITAAKYIKEHEYQMANLPVGGEEPYTIDAAGTGGLLVNRRVFEDPRMLIEPGDGEDPPVFFRDEETTSGRRIHGHDLDFTHRATQLGYKLYLHPQAWADHVKSLKLYGEVLRYVHHIVDQTVETQKKEWERTHLTPEVITVKDNKEEGELSCKSGSSEQES